MSHVINMLDAKTSLSKLVQALESGAESEFIIARNGRPAARLVPLGQSRSDRSRRIGIAKGRFAVPDDIDQSNAEVRKLFEGP
ncbi:MAG TPA: type II toxin-antitoxin system Phd/YefM family antitoxin [Rubrivivax sp.]|nr:type II toxin-antitoxin system Phd/YefM family antitoxin [Rubrivivax sp.]